MKSRPRAEGEVGRRRRRPMPEFAGKGRPPGGKRVGRTEVERRLLEVERMAVEGRPRYEIAEEMRERFGIAPTTTDDYLRRVRERWSAEAAETHPIERERALARLRSLSRAAEARGAFGAAVSAERLASELLGLRSPERINAPPGATPGAPPTPELTMAQVAEEFYEVIPALTRMLGRGDVAVTDELLHRAREFVATLELCAKEDGIALHDPKTGQIGAYLPLENGD